MRHWAHKGQHLCDQWWENETEWHRAWKVHFPPEWQEVVHQAGAGDRHIADVKTSAGWVIEFQYSYLAPVERRSREAFYQKLIWVVDGTRRKRDRSQLIKAVSDGVSIGRNALIRQVFMDDCRLLREWADSRAPIFFDLGEPEWLCWLFARGANGWAYIAPYPRGLFIDGHRNPASDLARQFDAFVNDSPMLISQYEAAKRATPIRWDPLAPRRPLRRFRF